MTTRITAAGKAVIISHFERIICPECEKVQPAVVKHTMPQQSRLHVCEFCQHVIIYTTSEADAALLEAAPDLLEACKAALDWRGLDGDGISDPTRQQLIKAVEKTEKDNEQSRAKALYEIADSAYQRAVTLAEQLHNTETP